VFDAPPGLLRAAPKRWPRRRAAVGAPAGVFLVVVLAVGAAGAQGLHPLERGTPPTGGPGTSAAVSRAADPMVQVAYDQPPPTPDPAAPGTSISSGPDETDPFMVVANGHYYLFTSRSGPGPNVPVRSATVLGRWGPTTDALPQLPAWAAPGWAWAPDVRRFGDHYVLYFTTLLRGSSPPTMCIGDAVGTEVNGPFEAEPSPLVCQASLDGSIDPRTFVDADGQPYLLWKSDQNAVSHTTDTQIYSQPLSADGLHLLGQSRVIFSPDEPWQGYIVEAPELVEVDSVYYLFYSGSWFNQPGYAIGVAQCDGPLGPCADASPAPLLASNAQGAGPGEESVFSDAKGIWLLYAPFHSAVPLSGPPRPSTIAHLGFGSSGVYLAETPADPASA
jgi:Glycosyl hydrolases family 43